MYTIVLVFVLYPDAVIARFGYSVYGVLYPYVVISSFVLILKYLFWEHPQNDTPTATLKVYQSNTLVNITYISRRISNNYSDIPFLSE